MKFKNANVAHSVDVAIHQRFREIMVERGYSYVDYLWIDSNGVNANAVHIQDAYAKATFEVLSLDYNHDSSLDDLSEETINRIFHEDVK